TGWSREEALGKDCSILAGDAINGCACGAGPLRCGLASSGKSAKCCSAVSKTGKLLLIVKNAVPIHSSSGEIVGALECFSAVPPSTALASRPGLDPAASGTFQGLVGREPAMLELYRTVALVAGSDATVLVLGESGTGKERVAEAVHALSRRSAGPFVRVSCSALSENLLESELFGQVEGAFTGAGRDRRGRFHEAHGGTLFLDEIGDISPAVQVKLLRVIESRQIERIGDSASIPVDVRLVCATHRDLKALVETGRFRADLFFRIAVFPIRVPPLREHLGDLPLLAELALSGARSSAAAPQPLSRAALDALAAYPWPGNVRELQNVLEFAAVRAAGQPIGLDDLPEEIRGRAIAKSESGSLGREAITVALDATGWNRAAAARLLGISRVTLWKRLKALGITPPRS
ncbi:MAG TPA: sigma 54-interacting transcriptional regulator, partial [Anaeromyxobacter sp.]|nr:sigma 54-interacting transcriptional regulator [Anaeromyxobacter sp.]